jgi:hypothetical protein
MRARRLVFVGHAVAERVDGVYFLVYRAYEVRLGSRDGEKQQKQASVVWKSHVLS